MEIIERWFWRKGQSEIPNTTVSHSTKDGMRIAYGSDIVISFSGSESRPGTHSWVTRRLRSTAVRGKLREVGVSG